jgi:hypothetical protein
MNIALDIDGNGPNLGESAPLDRLCFSSSLMIAAIPA